ncbi:MAG: hypothetical protein ABGZ53_01590 [Fuerstiella sp.]
MDHAHTASPTPLALKSIKDALFDDSIISRNVVFVRARAKILAPADRYDFLLNCVLPSDTHAAMRLSAMLTPGDPVVPLIGDHPFDVQRQSIGKALGQRRIHTGGNLVSPAYDLVRTAQQLGRLDNLRSLIDRCEATAPLQKRCKLILQCFAAMADGDEQAAGLAADQLSLAYHTPTSPSMADRWPETMFAWAAVENQQLLTEAETILTRIFDDQICNEDIVAPGEWKRLIGNLRGRVQHLGQQEAAGSIPYTLQPALKNWHAVSLTESWASGNGVPAAHWQLTDRTVVNLSSHGAEYLMFGVPLRGNFTFECECTGFGYKDCHPSVAGSWIAPVYDHDSF